MSRTTKLAFKFLRELNSSNVQDTFESLGTLLEYLERKNDPEPVEVQMVDTAYQALEKLKTLEGLINVILVNQTASRKEINCKICMIKHRPQLGQVY